MNPLRKLGDLIETYPGIVIDLIFAFGLLGYAGLDYLTFELDYFLQGLADPSIARGLTPLFFIVPLFQLHALMLAGAWPHDSANPSRWTRRVVWTCVLLLVSGPLFLMTAEGTFVGDKRGSAFAVGLARLAYTAVMLLATLFVLAVYTENLEEKKPRTPGTWERRARSYVTWLTGNRVSRITLTVLVVPLYFTLLQVQTGWVSTAEVIRDGFSFKNLWDYLFYGGNLFVMIYFLAARILILARPPYTKVELLTATLGFLKFAGFLTLLGYSA